MTPTFQVENVSGLNMGSVKFSYTYAQGDAETVQHSVMNKLHTLPGQAPEKAQTGPEQFIVSSSYFTKEIYILIFNGISLI